MRFSLFLITIILSTFSYAANEATQKQTPTIVDIANQESSVVFLAIGKPSLLKISGEKGRLTGKVEYLADEFSADLHVKLSDITTGIRLRDEHMKEKYLQIKEFPEAILKVEKLKLTTNPMKTKTIIKDLPFAGKLTIHGVEKPVDGLLNIDSQSGDFVNVVATIKTNLSNHNIEVPSYMGIKVADEVQIKSEFKIKN